MRLRDLLTKILLWWFGVAGLLAIVPALMPRTWLVAAVEQVEPGTPVLFLVEYMARSLSAMYFLLGALLCLCATDLRRYAPAIRLLCVGCIFLGPLVCGAILTMPYPLHVIAWTFAADAGLLAAFGVAVLLLQRKGPTTGSN